MSEAKDITHLLERLEAFEEKCEVRLNAMSAFIDEYREVVINGELHPREGLHLKQGVALNADAYDAGGRLVGGTNRKVAPNSFFGYYSFTIRFRCPGVELAKIRIFPQQHNQ
jgi:hypothetical protein